MKYKNLEDFLIQKNLSQKEFEDHKELISFVKNEEEKNKRRIGETEKQKKTEDESTDFRKIIEGVFVSREEVISACKRIQSAVSKTKSIVSEIKIQNFEKCWGRIYRV